MHIKRNICCDSLKRDLTFLLVIVQFSHQKRHICKVGNADPKQNNYPNCKLGIEHCGQKDCNSDQEYCTAVFKEENGHLAPVLAGCWEKPDSTVQVDTNECVLRHQPRKDYIMYECWCNGELCNNNITFPKYIVNPAGMMFFVLKLKLFFLF